MPPEQRTHTQSAATSTEGRVLGSTEGRIGEARGELARRGLELAYGELGGRSGMLVDFPQIKALLVAEASVLQARSPKSKERIDWLLAASRLDTRNHQRRAVTHLVEKADEWEKKASRASDTDMELELARRSRACRASADLIFREKLKRKPEGFHPDRKHPKTPPVEEKVG